MYDSLNIDGNSHDSLDILSRLNSFKNLYDKINEINKLYRIIKNRPTTAFTTKFLNMIESTCFSDSYICDTSVDFVYDSRKRKFNSSFNEKEILDTIVYQTRKCICDELGSFVGIHNDPLFNLCRMTSSYVKINANKAKINCHTIMLSPYLNMKLDGGIYHYASIITIGDKKYIVDLTYKQFFTAVYCALERKGMPGYSVVLPGVFMLMNDSRYKTASELLKSGYIEATDENIKNYMDGFIISYRNNVYYDDMGFVDYTTHYSADDYREFLYFEDNSFYDTPLEHLGFYESNTQIDNTDLVFDTDGNNCLIRALK